MKHTKNDCSANDIFISSALGGLQCGNCLATELPKLAKELVELYATSPDDSPQQDHAVRELEKLGYDKQGNKA